MACIGHQRTQKYLGAFDSEELAAEAYDYASLIMKGKTAPLNFPDRRNLYLENIKQQGLGLSSISSLKVSLYRRKKLDLFLLGVDFFHRHITHCKSQKLALLG